MNTPPPLPEPASSKRRTKFLILVAVVPTCVVVALIVLRVCGLVRPFSVPTGSMTPTVSPGDHLMVENVTFLSREPHRGDIVVFKADGITPLPPATFHVKRVAGEPGNHVRITEGKLFINEKPGSLSNAVGGIAYHLPAHADALIPRTDATVPAGCYFVLGDNSTNSFDSRFWGAVPRGNIIGRVSFCYWPPTRVGTVK